MSSEPYVEMLKEHGIGFEAAPLLLKRLCTTFEESARTCADVNRDGSVLEADAHVNLVAATDPEVATAFSLGIMRTKQDSLLVLPPDWLMATRVRDAVWVEGDSASVKRGPEKKERRQEAYAASARGLCVVIQRTFALGGAPLGPRSFRCHQDYVLAATPPGDLFDGAGKLSDKKAEQHPHGHDAWERMVLVLPAPWPADMTLHVDVCMRCMATTRSTTRLGLAVTYPAHEHRHSWVRFASAVQDAKGHAGLVRGEVCLEELPSLFPEARPGRCMQTKSVKFDGRTPVLSITPKWAREDRSILRPPAWARGRDGRELIQNAVRLSRGHVHVWDNGRYTFGPGAALPFVRCLTCESELWSDKIEGVSVPSLVKELSRRIAAVGGFARGNIGALDEVLEEFRQRYNSDGELREFSDQLALEACDDGLRKSSPAQRQAIWDALHTRRDDNVAWRKVMLTVERDGREHKVQGHVLAEGHENSYFVYRIDGVWEIAHAPTLRCFSVRAGDLDEAMSIAAGHLEAGRVPARSGRESGIMGVE